MLLTKCPKCNLEVPPVSVVCPHCGQEARPLKVRTDQATKGDIILAILVPPLGAWLGLIALLKLQVSRGGVLWLAATLSGVIWYPVLQHLLRRL